MKQRTKRVIANVIATGGVIAIVAGGIWMSSALGSQEPRPTPSPTGSGQVVNPVPQPAPTSADRTVDDLTVPEPVEVPVPPVEAPTEPTQPGAGTQPEPQPAQPQPEPEVEVEPAPPPPPPPPPPVTCPAGSTSVGSDGTNDTACLPDVCFTLTLPDPNHPECDAPFRP